MTDLIKDHNLISAMMFISNEIAEMFSLFAPQTSGSVKNLSHF